MKLRKYFLVIFVLFLSLCFESFGQSRALIQDVSVGENHIDSLTNLYEDYKRQEEDYIKKKHFIGVAYTLLDISKLEFEFNQFFESENSAIKGLKYLDSVKGYEKQVTIYRYHFFNRLGNLMEVQEEL